MKQIIFIISYFIVANTASAQNVGIGLSNPTRAALEVNGAVGSTAAIFGGDSTGISLIRNWPSVGFNLYYDGNHRFIGDGYAAMQYVDQSNGNFAFDFFDQGLKNGIATGAKRIVTLTNNGNFWIGQNPHNSSLSVPMDAGIRGASACFLGAKFHSAINTLPFDDTYIRAGYDGGTVFLNDIPGGTVSFHGKLGINTTYPYASFELHCRNVGPGHGGMLLVDPTHFAYWEYSITSETMRLSSSGGGWGYFNTNGVYYSSSDGRLKKNVEDLEATLPKLRKLRPVSYEMIHDSLLHTSNIGFIAQELRELFPELVKVHSSVNGNTGIKDLHTVSYSALHPIAVKAVQEQQTLIQRQIKEIEALEQECEKLLQTITEKQALGKK